MKKLKKMIKSAILFAATGLAFGLTSCTNDNLESTNGSADKLYIIYGGFAQNENSRMSLNTVANQYDWQVGDGVCLYKEDGSLLTYHAITSSEITENGKIRLELRLPAEPKYITMAGKNGTYTTDGAYVDVNRSVIDLYARTPSGILSPDAPILSQAKITDSLVNGNHLQIFAMQHKLAYVYIKGIKIDGAVLNHVYVTTTSGTMKITDVTNQDSETSLSNVAEIESSIMIGYVIAVIPGTTLTISKDATSKPFVNAKLDPGYYTVERDIHTEYTMTYTSDNTTQGTVSSATETAIKGGAASAVTATANTGYIFEGWYNNGVKLGASGTDANGNAYTVSGAVLTITNAQSSASYVAKFSQNTYTVTYNANGGIGANVTAVKTQNVAYTIAANTFTAPDGKAFNGWNTNANGTGTAYAAGASYTANANLTLYAQWRISNFKSVYTKDDYYQWDAYEPYQHMGITNSITTGPWGVGSAWYNPTEVVSETAASASCKNCATHEQIAMYLGAGGIYLDEGDAGTNQQSFTLPDGQVHHAGYWLKKKAYIAGFDAGTAPKAEKISGITIGRPSPAVIEQYFFLPCAGFYSELGSGVYTSGLALCYWTSSTADDGAVFKVKYKVYQLTNAQNNQSKTDLEVRAIQNRFDGFVRFYLE